MAMGIYPFRCLDCKERFFINIWLFSKKTAAVCPRCLTIEVNPASLEGKRLSLLQRIQVAIGARGYRCSTCGRRFLSFKRAHSLPASKPADHAGQALQAEPAPAASASK